MSQTVVLKENPLCPICGSKSSKSGKDKCATRTVQLFICKKCGKRFRESYVLNVETNPKYVKRKRRRKTRFRLKGKIPELSSLFKKPLNVNSIVGIPCFCCDKNPCDPSKCEKLTKWLVKNEQDT